jgi:hypothetical protein
MFGHSFLTWIVDFFYSGLINQVNMLRYVLYTFMKYGFVVFYMLYNKSNILKLPFYRWFHVRAIWSVSLRCCIDRVPTGR